MTPRNRRGAEPLTDPTRRFAVWLPRLIRGRVYVPRAVRILPSGAMISGAPVEHADASDAAAVRVAILAAIGAGVTEVSSEEGRALDAKPSPMDQLLGLGDHGPVRFWRILWADGAYRAASLKKFRGCLEEDPKGIIIERSTSLEDVATAVAHAIAQEPSPSRRKSARR